MTTTSTIAETDKPSTTSNRRTSAAAKAPDEMVKEKRRRIEVSDEVLLEMFRKGMNFSAISRVVGGSREAVRQRFLPYGITGKRNGPYRIAIKDMPNHWRLLRFKAGKTLVEVAEAVDCSWVNLSRQERTGGGFATGSLVKLAEYYSEMFGVDIPLQKILRKPDPADPILLPDGPLEIPPGMITTSRPRRKRAKRKATRTPKSTAPAGA